MKANVVRSAVIAAACGVALFTGVGAALAHIDPDPLAIEGGKPATVSFGVEHGCDGSPTTGLDFQVPDGVTDAQPVAKDGWTTDVADGVVKFSGGNLDAETPDTFSIAFTAPAAAGTIHFPVVQTCETGETAWIEIPAGGAAEPEHPAPAILVTDGPPTSADLAPADHDEATASTDEAEHHAEETTVDSAEADHHEEETTAESAVAVDTVTASPSSSDDSSSGDSSNTGLVVGIIAGVLVIGGGGAAVWARRRKNTLST